jgi:hypothetical protein
MGNAPPGVDSVLIKLARWARLVPAANPSKINKSTAGHLNVNDCMSHVFGGRAAVAILPAIPDQP